MGHGYPVESRGQRSFWAAVLSGWAVPFGCLSAVQCVVFTGPESHAHHDVVTRGTALHSAVLHVASVTLPVALCT